jgi:hypothetical protein
MKQPCNAHAYEQERIEKIHLSKVVRLEMLDNKGQRYIIRNADVELSHQDNSVVLKIKNKE